MGYEPKPHGNFDEEQSSGHPWLVFLFWLVTILGIWYEENSTVKRMCNEQANTPWEKPMKMSKGKRCWVILKCLLIDMKDNPRITLGCSVFILYLLIRCFI